MKISPTSPFRVAAAKSYPPDWDTVPSDVSDPSDPSWLSRSEDELPEAPPRIPVTTPLTSHEPFVLPEIDPPQAELPLSQVAARLDSPKVTVRHLGGAEVTAEVEEATDDGVLHLRWPGAVGTGVYALHVFRLAPQPPPPIEGRGEPAGGTLKTPEGSCWVWKTTRSRAPLPWRAADPEAARALWRAMTGRDAARKWIAVWRDGKRQWVPT